MIVVDFVLITELLVSWDVLTCKCRAKFLVFGVGFEGGEKNPRSAIGLNI